MIIDCTASCTIQIEIGMVGKIDHGIGIGCCLIVYLDSVLICKSEFDFGGC